MRNACSHAVFLCMLSVVLACSDEGAPADQDTALVPQTTATPGTPAAPAGALTEASITAEMLAFGDSIFEGQAAGGLCYTCHGPDGKGGPLAPDLTDQQWLHGDGSLSFIAEVVRNGIAQPKQHPAPMPAFNATLNEQQVRAVAAYVYSLSHRLAGG